MTIDRTAQAGSVRAGDGAYVFQLAELGDVETGKGYSSAIGPVVEGDRMQCGLMRKARGSGSRPHHHPNEQWNYVISGRLRVHIDGEPDRIVGPGTLIYLPANKVHATVALPEEDVVFFVVKDMSFGIVGLPADGTQAGAHYEPGFAPPDKEHRQNPGA